MQFALGAGMNIFNILLAEDRIVRFSSGGLITHLDCASIVSSSLKKARKIYSHKGAPTLQTYWADSAVERESATRLKEARRLGWTQQGGRGIIFGIAPRPECI